MHRRIDVHYTRTK